MLIVFYFMIFLVLSDKLLNGENLIREFKRIPDNKVFQLNDTVVLSCEILKLQDQLVTMFRRDKAMYSEDCRVFNPSKYEMKCINRTENSKFFVEFRFTIKRLEWTDRGNWECLNAQKKQSTLVEITVPAVFEQMEIDPIKPKETKLENTGPAYLPIDSKGNHILKGRGSRTNPYNLREGIALKITCTSSCSSPKAIHVWSYANATHGPTIIDVKSQRLRGLCSSSTNDGMYSSLSETVINCTTLNMMGANEIVCSAPESVKTSIYVLCPGGERPWELTTGEIIGVATSVGIIILLVFLLCLMVKRSRSAYRTPPDVSTNTYSSGVKV